MARKKRSQTSNNNNNKKGKQKAPRSIPFSPEITAICIVAVGLFLLASFFAGDGTGAVGEFFKNLFFGFFGFTAYLCPFYMLALATNLLFEKEIKKHKSKFIYTLGLMIMLSATIHFFSSKIPDYDSYIKAIPGFFTAGTELTGGGIIGGILYRFFAETLSIGRVGTAIVYICVISILSILLFHISVKDLLENAASYLKEARAKHAERKVQEQQEKERKKPREYAGRILTETDENTFVAVPELSDEDDSDYDEIYVPPEEDIIIGPDSPVPPENDKTFTDSIVDENNQVAMNMESEEDTEEEEEPFTLENNGDLFINYQFPTVDLLTQYKKSKKGMTESEINANAKKLVSTLASFGVQAKILQVTKGPAITRYELQPMAGVKVSKIVNLADDIALNLAAQGVRIEAPIPGKAAIGIEVANREIDMVSMREVLESDAFKNHPSKLAVALGKDISGTPIILDLAKMPHLLIAGQTGSGKSVCVNSIIASIMYKASPNEVKLLMVDPKVVELSVYNGIPHLDTPVVTKPKKAAGALSWAVNEMMLRYDMFAEAKVRDIKGYNNYAKSHNLASMPQVVIIIDELADLMMAAPGEVEDSICRLAQLARAAGMHLVIATQRPSVNVITGTIKANIPSRIAFATSNAIDSRTILDSSGAEKLLGRGDMLYHPTGASKPIRVQGAFLSDEERDAIIEFVKSTCTASYNPNILEHIEKESVSDKEKAESGGGECDDLLPKAIDIVMEIGQASTSMLQRKMSVGFARAGRIMDQMEQRGIVGPSQGSKPREILITKEQYMELKATGIFSEPMKYDAD
ncbi:MAG: DNA translocase FtsK 4TM domain-containing protein [Clostridia bacterium]|nr:DNA translocase FtsK 4TM domain-containing protein [Clostridia bacterium]